MSPHAPDFIKSSELVTLLPDVVRKRLGSRVAATLAGLGVLAIGSGLLAPIPASAQVTTGSTPAEAAAQSSPSREAVASHETFRVRVSSEIAEWRLKMHDFDTKAEARTKHQASAAEAKLRKAWDDTEAEARYVQAANAQDWDRAKRAYEAASHRMAAAWAKVRG